MKYFWPIFLLILSCGKRDLENQIENPLLGEWKLSKVSCYVNNYILLEEYTLPTNAKVSLSYIKARFVYEVSTPSCSMKYAGDYFYSISSFSDGKQSFYAYEGPSSTCETPLQEDQTGTIVPVSFYWHDLVIKNLFWEFDLEEKELILPGPFGFTGGSTISSGCSGQCLCFGHYKISSDT